ncbi:MAG: 4-(cytidine 5'-diphospho)-2-C-methyl-D-erythritol kinase [Acidobacteria bacterium]|nr:4-(cytidine 5'-diphospho)-2-C-methyl-D-erythritol kinase [Acidobacteriota bacterium]
MTTAFRIRACAKINLSLRVGDVRPDGFHALTTVFQSLALHDTLTVTVRRGPFALTCTDPGVPTDDRNLAWKAARAVWTALGRRGEPRDLAIDIDKHIPMQAGLGGGSSDAAAALVACHHVWTKGGRHLDLPMTAARLGADVPYFLQGGTALGLARGDELYPLVDVPPYWVVLALPPFGVPTADAYGWLDADRAATDSLHAHATQRLLPAWPGRLLAVANDLEGPVVRRHPEIGAVRDLLTRAGAAAASMTGSGSAVFGLFGTKNAADRAARAAAGAGTVAIVTRTVDRRTCQRVHFLFASSSPRHA